MGGRGLGGGGCPFVPTAAIAEAKRALPALFPSVTPALSGGCRDLQGAAAARVGWAQPGGSVNGVTSIPPGWCCRGTLSPPSKPGNSCQTFAAQPHPWVAAVVLTERGRSSLGVSTRPVFLPAAAAAAASLAPLAAEIRRRGALPGHRFPSPSSSSRLIPAASSCHPGSAGHQRPCPRWGA